MSGAPNAAIYYVPEGYRTAGERIMGIQAASEGMLHGFIRHAGVERLYAFAEHPASGSDFAQAVAAVDPRLATEWIPTGEVERLVPIGTLMLPGPGLSAYAWMRRRLGGDAFSLCGITHATTTPLVLDAIADLPVAPVEPWDAVICTSRAVQRMMAELLADQRRYLEERFGPIPSSGPALPVIPLGIDTTAFARKPAERRAWRERLGLAGEDDVMLLYLGRLDIMAKAHPLPLFLAGERAAARSQKRLHLVLAGWFRNPASEPDFRAAAAAFAPSLRLILLDGRLPQVRGNVWQAADIFVSPVDNIQESFGLTPVEAMAAELPVVAGDWNGYRDTVRDGVDGFLAPSLTPPPGSAPDLAASYSARGIDHDHYAGFTSQAVALDVEALASALARLADDPALRRAMGRAGRRHAQGEFDWAQIIPRYQALWVELAERRRGAAAAGRLASVHPARPDPFQAFAGYPSRFLAPETRLRRDLHSPELLEALLASPLLTFAGPALLPQHEMRWLLDRARGGACVAELLAEIDRPRHPIAWRSLSWLLKYGLLSIAAAQDEAPRASAPSSRRKASRRR
jgi:glycosyltransferase involved in cell wall biosynthesis